ncbi:MAG: GNAT family N-acetyltransferase [Flavobacteriales bacterium]
MEIIEAKWEEYVLTTDKTKLDLIAVHDYLSNHSYWAKNIPMEVVKSSAANSLTISLLYQEKVAGYARVVTDYSTFAYLCDVYILEEHRGKGLSKWMMEFIHAHPNLQGLRRWVLLMLDAHGLYTQFGWTSPKMPDRYMERHNPKVYQENPN